jgi:hypothetical protein
VGGGRNSRVYRVAAPSSPPLAAKFFYRVAPERQNRPVVEFEGLQFLWKHGERSIPRPVALHPEEACAFYEFVEGRPVPPAEVGPEELRQALEFLARLKRLGGAEGSAALPPAAEACFSLEALAENLESRVRRLMAVPDRTAPYPALRAFLEEDFARATASLLERARRRLKGTASVLPVASRALSPSDFGFHNSIRRRDGSLTFVDFEYFGWDDPAKTISDFLLHPAMRLRAPARRRFLQGALAVYADDADLEMRLDSFYPLFGLKWCLILLNEFVPQDLTRRAFAGGAAISAVAARKRQLARARRLLARVCDTQNGTIVSTE